MAVRLPLILSQPFRRDASAIDLLENIVAAAILVPGLDANLVGDISVMEVGSTDYLCLEAHTRDVILASFLEPSLAQSAWKKLELQGDFIDFNADEEAIKSARKNSIATRIVFYFQLSSDTSGPTLLDKCQKLLVAQRLSLVSIQLSPSGLSTASPMSSSRPTLAKSTLPKSTLPILPLTEIAAPRTTPPGATPPRATMRPLPPTTQPMPQNNNDEQDWAELDKLVDDLGEMDL